jgi:hypothetical protein
MAVVEMTDGASAFIYHNWLFPENSAKLTVIGSRKMLIYEGKFEKRAITIYDYTVERDGTVTGCPQDLPTTIPSKITAQHTLPGLTEQEPLALAVDDFLHSIVHGRAPMSDGVFSLKVLETLAAGEKSLHSGGTKVGI